MVFIGSLVLFNSLYIVVSESVYFIFDELSFCDKEDGQNISKAKGLLERFINKGPIFIILFFYFNITEQFTGYGEFPGPRIMYSRLN